MRTGPCTDRDSIKKSATPHDFGQAALVLGALGVVFGDIGTRPIYAVRQAVVDAGSSSVQVVMGVLSMMIWTVTILVTLDAPAS